MTEENIIFEIILHAGDARSNSINAYKALESNNFEEAESLLKKASVSLNKAHKVQTEIIQKEVRGERQEITLLMVHAQDHVMTAQVIRDMAAKTVAIVRSLDERLKKLESGNEND